MLKLLARYAPLLASGTALAQTASTEAVVEPASALTVDIFLFVFVASIVGFLAYSWWMGKKKGKAGPEE